MEEKSKKSFPIWSLLYDNLALIIIVTILFGCLGFGYSKVKKSETFTATKIIMISATVAYSLDADVVTANESLVSILLPTISTALKSNDANTIMNNYIDENKGTEPEKDIYVGNINLSYSSSKLICTLSYSSTSEEDAKLKLDYVIDGFSYWLEEYKKMDKDIVSAGTVSIMPVQKVATIEQSSPYMSDVSMFAVIGLFLAFIFVIVRDVLDTKVKCEQDIIDITGDGVLAFLEKY